MSLSKVRELPRFPLGLWPTPLQEASRLSELLGARLLIKREDMTGLGAGGNKARKLEFHLGHALQEGATHLVTTGAIQSNHAFLTAAASGIAGLKAHLVLSGEQPADRSRGNVLLDRLVGAEFTFVPSSGVNDSVRIKEQMGAVGQRIEAEGGRALLIPEGGTDLLGTLGYAVALDELAGQLEELGLRHVLVAVAAGTCGTLAGLLTGTHLTEHKVQIDVLGVSISGFTQLKRAKTARLVNEALQWSGSSHTITAEDVRLDDRFVGDGYASMTEEGSEAIRLTAQQEGILLDPVYTGKAMAGLLSLGRAGELQAYEAVVFLHTGGLPLLFHYGTDLYGLG
ncbi:D-cysteine desulfhydrase family protein [Paenibacillus filicis]|uniref:D-cysteine desulfhydrase family protein n=1 Tax=Paenibacillus filicis TaxID=669464 RepID=A0ABU9DG01_9BACL